MSKKRKTRKSTAVIWLCILLVLTVAAGWLGLTGAATPFSGGLYRIKSWLPTVSTWPDSLSLGLDLEGGVYVEYSASRPEGSDADFASLMENTMSVIQYRLSDKGMTEATVQQIGTDGIRVEIPDVSDPAEILNLIGTPAKLEFFTEDSPDEAFMDGSMVQTATAGVQDGDYVVAFTLTSEGSKLFAEKTAENIGKTISIYLDGELLISPTVQSVIANGSGVINGMGSMERAETIASQIQSGALPLTLTQQKVDTVSATLGKDALSTSVKAAIIGLLLVMLLMIVRYRLNGLIASWALIVYIILLFFCLAVIPGIQLTLPGLAGIVLGIGMAVDANVVIYERFNEELVAGRPIRAAVRAGFQNALSAIVDANVTTLIAAIVLLFFGTGSVQGFAKTLLLGVVVSMLTALILTRVLMRLFSVLTVDKKNLYVSAKKLAKIEEEVQA